MGSVLCRIRLSFIKKGKAPSKNKQETSVTGSEKASIILFTRNFSGFTLIPLLTSDSKDKK